MIATAYTYYSINLENILNKRLLFPTIHCASAVTEVSNIAKDLVCLRYKNLECEQIENEL